MSKTFEERYDDCVKALGEHRDWRREVVRQMREACEEARAEERLVCADIARAQVHPSWCHSAVMAVNIIVGRLVGNRRENLPVPDDHTLTGPHTPPPIDIKRRVAELAGEQAYILRALNALSRHVSEDELSAEALEKRVAELERAHPPLGQDTIYARLESLEEARRANVMLRQDHDQRIAALEKRLVARISFEGAGGSAGNSSTCVGTGGRGGA